MTGFFIDTSGDRARDKNGALAPSFTGSVPVKNGANDGVNFATLAGLAGHYGAWTSRSRQRRSLAELDARVLRDIGVTAYDAACEASKPFCR